MIPGLNPRMMRQAMKRMGIQEEEIDAIQVIIRTPEKDLVFNAPAVSKINMMGQETYQIIGEPEEIEREINPEISEDDINTVVTQTGVSKEKAKELLERNKGDIAKTILELQK